jgi:hypothetical protein
MSTGYDQEAELSSALQRMVKTVTRGSVVVDGTIVSVDETAFTCDVEVGDSVSSSTYFDVPLRVLIGEQSSVIEIPENGTQCVICFRDSNIGRPQIVMIHKALKILVICDNITFNNGTLGGLVKLNDLVAKLNTIESDLNTLKAAFSAWAVVTGDGGAALKAVTAAWYGQILQPTLPVDLENPKIKQ